VCSQFKAVTSDVVRRKMQMVVREVVVPYVRNGSHACKLNRSGIPLAPDTFRVLYVV
jgi:hypothetical protein